MSKSNSKDSGDRPYEVGYGKPPKNTQFKKGQSGNKAGRPENKKKYLCDMVEKAFYAERTIRLNGKAASKSTMEIMLMKVSEMAMNGDIKAARLMTSLSEKYGLTVPEYAFIAPYIPSRTEMKAMDPDFDDDNL